MSDVQAQAAAYKLRTLAMSARAVSDAMSQRGKWQMCIPPQDNDSDCIIYELARVAEEAADLLSAVEDAPSDPARIRE